VASVALVGAVTVARRQTPVGEAPPLTPMAAGSASAEPTQSSEPVPAALGPEPRQAQAVATLRGQDGEWRVRHIRVDVHPLDTVFSDDGATVYVSGDDAKIRAYEVQTGKLVHIMAVPAQGDRLKLLNGRYLAVIRHHDAGHVPIVDVQTWERDAMLLHVGADPADVLALPDGKTVLTASSKGRRLSWWDLASGRELGELRLPHVPQRLYLLHSHGRTYVGAMGQLYQGDRPTSASLEVFDPSERPFGATRRSVSIGRDPQPGAVTHDGNTLIVADRLSNSAWIFHNDAKDRPTSVPVGSAPIAAFVLDNKWGITLDSEARTATVIDLASAKRTTTLMLPETPSAGAVSSDGKTLFVSLGGSWPPSGSGVAMISGSPPQVVLRRDTGAGAGRVALSLDGARAAIACYAGRELTVLER
jgi:DNA-binding beta-propeller fold protein YncE